MWQYYRATGDDDFLLAFGAEIYLDTARFWASRAVAEADGRRHIRHVIGPDEEEEHADRKAPRDKEGDRGPGTPVGCDHAPNMG